jgi:hypothetical protein
LLAGCGDSLQPILCDGGPCGSQTSFKKNYQAAYDRRVDVLFVVDDTAAMAPNIGTLADGFAGIVQRLLVPYGATSFHVGFVRAGGCDASTRAATCGVNAPEQFMRAEWCRTMTNFGGSFADTFSCLADLGTANCGPAKPLAAAVQALAEPAPAGWEGFLRPDAYLVIGVVAAQDDASGAPVADLAARLKTLKADPSQVLVSVIGPGDCAPGDVPGPRLSELVSQFGANGSYLGLCSGALPAALDRLAEHIGYSIDPPCLSNVLDTDPSQPGLQASCSVVDRVIGQNGSETISSLPSCDQSAPPCWSLVLNGRCAVFGIDRGADWCEEAATSGTVECLTCSSTTDPACALTRPSAP